MAGQSIPRDDIPPMVFGQEHHVVDMRLPGVLHARGRVVEAEVAASHEGPPVFTEIDGEPLGTLPARYEALPAAITLLGVDS